VQIPKSFLQPMRTLTTNIALEMSYASGQHEEALFATAIVLFIIIMILNSLAGMARRKAKKKRKAPADIVGGAA